MTSCKDCFYENFSKTEFPCMTCSAFKNYVHKDVYLKDDTETPKTALETQVAGQHYKKYKIQPVEFIVANKLEYCEANIVKYITRWRDKGGKQDLEKVIHYVQLLMQLEGL